MKNIMKLGVILLFVGLLIFIYFYFQKEEDAEQKVDSDEMEEVDYDTYMDSLNDPLDTRLTYDKEMVFVYVSEMNNNALNVLPFGNLVDDEVSFNEETKSIYFYNEKLIPRENTSMIILSEVYNYDVMLKQVVEAGVWDSTTLYVNDISFNELEDELQPVENENRLFLDERLHIEQMEKSDSIRVSFMEEEFILEQDEYRDFVLEDGDVKSRILIRNFGSWETINMKYQIKE